jgi:nicotinamidase-related amidase
MNDFRVDAATTALLVIDLQQGSVSPDLGYSNVFRFMGFGPMVEARNAHIFGIQLPKVQQLQAAFRMAGGPVVFLTVGSVVGDLSDMPPRFRRVAAYCKEHGLPLPWSWPGSRETAILEQVAPLPGEAVIVKTGASGFTGSPLDAVLRSRGVRKLVFCGVATSFCVESTLRDASDRGFDCVLVEDACADMNVEFHRRGVESCRYFARVESTDVILLELNAGAGAQREK